MNIAQLNIKNTKHHDDMMDCLRHILSEVMMEHNLNASSWALKSGKSRNFLTEFYSGRSNDMTIGSLEALAKAVDLSAFDILQKVQQLSRGA